MRPAGVLLLRAKAYTEAERHRGRGRDRDRRRERADGGREQREWTCCVALAWDN